MAAATPLAGGTAELLAAPLGGGAARLRIF
jgi:hypothetical protein